MVRPISSRFDAVRSALLWAGAMGVVLAADLPGDGAFGAESTEEASASAPSDSQARDTDGGNETEAEAERALDERVAALVEAMGSARYEEREQASRAMRNLVRDPEQAEAVIRRMGLAYSDTRDPEVRVRIGRIAEDYFTHEVLSDRLRVPSFLGVSTQQSPTRVPEGPDGEQPAAEVAMRIDRVLPDTAAEKHGLRAGDLIVGMDGQRFGPDYRFEDFTGYIRDRGAGTVVVFSVIRPPAMDRVREMEITLGVMPNGMLTDTEREELDGRVETLRQRWWEEAFTAGRAQLPEPDRDDDADAQEATEADPDGDDDPNGETEPGESAGDE